MTPPPQFTKGFQNSSGEKTAPTKHTRTHRGALAGTPAEGPRAPAEGQAGGGAGGGKTIQLVGLAWGGLCCEG